jgi:outer membrane protein TolC
MGALLSFCLIQEASASTNLSGLIDFAIEHSPVLQKHEAQRSEGKWKKGEGISYLLPTLNLNASHIIDKKYQYLNIPFGGGPIVEFPQIFPSSSASLSARWTLFDGLANINLFRSGLRASSAAESRYQWERFQLTQEVTLAYSKYLASKALEEVAKSNLKTLENHATQVQNLKTGGLATHYDILKVESQLSEARVELLQAEDNIEIARDRLMVLIGGSKETQIEDASLPSPDDAMTEKIKSLDLSAPRPERKDLQALREQVEAADFLDSAASFFWSPRISLGANYIEYNNLSDTLTDWSRYRSAWDVGIYLNWNLFGPKDFSNAKQNQYRAIAARKDLETANLQAPVDFAFWKKRFLYSASLFKAKNTDLNRATETVRLADAGFKAGVRTTTEVLDAELELFRARAGIVNAQINCIEAKIKLELANGEKL